MIVKFNNKAALEFEFYNVFRFSFRPIGGGDFYCVLQTNSIIDTDLFELDGVSCKGSFYDEYYESTFLVQLGFGVSVNIESEDESIYFLDIFRNDAQPIYLRQIEEVIFGSSIIPELGVVRVAESEVDAVKTLAKEDKNSSIVRMQGDRLLISRSLSIEEINMGY